MRIAPISIFASLSLTLLLLPGGAGAQGLTRSFDSLSDAELDQRIAFIEQRLDEGEFHAKWWQRGWTGVYAAGVVLGTGRAAATDSGKNRADYITTAVKGVIGTTRMLLQPLPGRDGAAPLDESLWGDTREAKVRRLQHAEEILMATAKRAEQRMNWIPHAANIGLNLVGAGFILGFGHGYDALESFLVGATVGEASIFSAPKRGIQDLEDYQTRFGMKSADRFEWSIVPTLGGAALQVTF